MKRFLVANAILFLSVGGFAACASGGGGPAVQMYAGPEQPQAQVAFVSIKDSDGWETRIRSVDGRPAPAGARKIALLPGKHSIFIDVVISQSGSGVTSRATGNKTIELDAVAGRSYVIDKGNIR